MLNPRKLEPSDQFTADLELAIKADGTPQLARENLIKLFQQYGHAFASQLELGGVLHSTTVVSKEKNVSRPSVTMGLR